MKGLAATTLTLSSVLLGLAVLAILGSTAHAGGCSLPPGESTPPRTGGAGFLATAYGPPWGGIQGDGITATGLNLTAGSPALEVAVDPSVIALRSYVHITPNPFGTTSAFYAGDTGGAITGHHIDIYDWRGRASQLAWGERTVTVTPAPNPGAGNLLGGVAPVPTETTTGGADTAEDPGENSEMASAGGCTAALGDGTLGLSAGETARVLADGNATAPAQAPTAVQRAIAAGNAIHNLPYPEPDVHYGTLARIWPAYDCSGATSFVLYAAGLLGPGALDSTALEDYGLPGPGRWITVYANSAHTWIVVAGIALDTADYGGPPIPAGSGPRWRTEPLANLQDGTSYTVRHPPGL